MFSSISLGEPKRFNFPFRNVKDSETRLFGIVKGTPMTFGNIYSIRYPNAKGRGVSHWKLPLYDRFPLIICLGVTQDKVIAFNLHFAESRYKDDPKKEPVSREERDEGIDDVIRFEDDEDPIGAREIVITMVNIIKQKLNLFVEPGQDIFSEQNVNEDLLENEYFYDPGSQAYLEKVAIEGRGKLEIAKARGKLGIEWGELMKMNNRYLRMLRPLMRTYARSKISMVMDIDDPLRFPLKEKRKVLQEDGLVGVGCNVGGEKWPMSSRLKVMRKAMMSDDNAWTKVIYDKIRAKIRGS
jgi:hypothetical protein